MTITLETLRQYQPELIQKFGGRGAVAYNDISRTQLSIARYSGGCMVQGSHYVYNPTDDSLIRADVVKWLVKRLKEDAKKSDKPRAAEATLFDGSGDGTNKTGT